MKPQFEWILERIKKLGTTLILEIGAGKSSSAHDTNDLTKAMLNEGLKVWGCDLKDVQYKHPNFKFTQGAFETNNYPSKFFEIIVSCATLHHIGKAYEVDVPKEQIQTENPNMLKVCLEEINRTLKDEGHIFITTDIQPSPRRGDSWNWDKESVDNLLSAYFETIEIAQFKDGEYTCYCLHLKKKENFKSVEKKV